MTDLELLEAACTARGFSYAPYSQYQVGAALEAEDGRVFLGCNVENAAYGSSICAERTALLKAVSEGARRFSRIAIVGSSEALCYPCGSCRQMLSEFAPALEVLSGSAVHERFEKSRLDALLPHSFGPSQLEKATV